MNEEREKKNCDGKVWDRRCDGASLLGHGGGRCPVAVKLLPLLERRGEEGEPGRVY